jgi:4-alpha-glucanotransferase
MVSAYPMTLSRIAGCTVPLFSLRTRKSWGIGQITDLFPFAQWLRTGGMRLLQILPPHELAAGETSPYGARTAFGLDPIYIDLEAVPDLDAAAIDEVLGADGKRELERLRATSTVDYAAVRALKFRVLRRAFDHFYEHEWLRRTARAKELDAFIAREAAWENDLALYVALREAHEERGWDTWPDPERRRDRAALARLAEAHAPRVLEHQYAQWVAHEQWQKAREGLQSIGVELMGDLPFVVGHESADVWSHANQFQRGASLGAPPDGFTPDGQDWGLPPYDWAAMDADNLAWIRARARHAGKLYDRFRLDHVVGCFRQFVIQDKVGAFDPSEEKAQHRRGDGVLSAMAEAARPAKIVAEDLGVIPDFVRQTLTRLGIPGYKVIPWERDFVKNVYNTPDSFPEISVAAWSTHDTAPITSWWKELQDWERIDLAKMIGIAPNAGDDERWTAIMRSLLEARSEITLVLVQEILGEGRRINTPGTVGPENWTYRLPKPIEDLVAQPALAQRMEALRAMAVHAKRVAG